MLCIMLLELYTRQGFIETFRSLLDISALDLDEKTIRQINLPLRNGG